MNRILKFIFLSLIFLSPSISFSLSYTATGNDLDFNSTKTWGIDPSAVGTGDFLIIDDGNTINVMSNVKVTNLRIVGGGRLKINTTNDVVITITETLEINDGIDFNTSFIDFGTGNVTFIIKGNLIGAAFSKIIHNPAKGKTQQLILQGKSNTLYEYIIPSAASSGTSIVRYEGANQDVFNAGPYSQLELTGGRPKTLLAPSSIGSGEATVKDSLIIKNSRLILNNNNFNYTAADTKLKCENGWVETNKNGTYSSTHSDMTRTFPVGNASNMMALSLTDIASVKITVRFGERSMTDIPNSGVGAWYISPSTKINTKITFVKAAGISPLLPESNIALFTSPVWKIQPTTYIANNSSYTSTNNILLTDITAEFGLFTCPAFITSPNVLPDAIAGNDYNQALTVSGGTRSYSLKSWTSTPASYKLSDPVGPKDEIKITGTAPKSGQPVTLAFTIQDATGCQSSLSAVINTEIQTIWDGRKWSSVTPDGKTPNVKAIIAGVYTTHLHGNIKATDIIIQKDGILTVSIGDSLIATDSIKNAGRLIGMCGATIMPNFIDGNTAEKKATVIAPASMNTGIAGQPYSQTFTVWGDPKASLRITQSSLPTGSYEFDKIPNTLTFTVPTTTTSLTFEINYIKKGFSACTTNHAITIKIIAPPSPNLAILPIGPKTFGDADFTVRTYSKSSGKITYDIISGSCAKIDSSGKITINCAGPSPQNIVTVRATQSASLPGTTPYKAETATETFVIKPAAGHFIVRNFAFLEDQNKPIINVYTKFQNPVPVYTFNQLSGTENAIVNPDGSVEPTAVGTFSVRISLAATNNYTAFDSTYTFTVNTLQIPPVAVADTIVLEMGKDTTVNILYNDKGMTENIDPAKTDIDIENSGIQSKFYSTELGNFLIDPDGNLTILPFNGFIGNGRLAYSVADINGLRSEVAYVEIIVNPPVVIPALKANTAMSPNGDNLNDALVIANTDLNTENSLLILDETGNTVYETTNYQNNWEGVNTKNDKLEPGTYFYIFKEKNSGRELKNYIQIVH